MYTFYRRLAYLATLLLVCFLAASVGSFVPLAQQDPLPVPPPAPLSSFRGIEGDPGLQRTTPIETVTEDDLVSAFYEEFDGTLIGSWTNKQGWSFTPTATGQGLQSLGEQKGVLKLAADQKNLILELDLRVHSGQAQIVFRKSDAGRYSLSVSASGLIKLRRDKVLLQEAQVFFDQETIKRPTTESELLRSKG